MGRRDPGAIGLTYIESNGIPALDAAFYPQAASFFYAIIVVLAEFLCSAVTQPERQGKESLKGVGTSLAPFVMLLLATLASEDHR